MRMLSGLVRWYKNQRALRLVKAEDNQAFPKLRKHLEGARSLSEGRLPVGLKIHCLDAKGAEHFLTPEGGWKTSTAFGTKKSVGKIVLPAVGSAAAAIEAVRILEAEADVQIFHSKAFQIQVCTAGSFMRERLSLLGVCTYLGSDWIRVFDETDFTYNQDTPHSVIIFGAGTLDVGFPYWAWDGTGKSTVLECLPFGTHERSDILACSSPTDIENVNLIGTLLHHVRDGTVTSHWHAYGEEFVRECRALLREHGLEQFMDIPWAPKHNKDSWMHPGDQFDPHAFYTAFKELSSYALDEAEAWERARARGDMDRCARSILYQMRSLLDRYARIVSEDAKAVRRSST